MLTETVRDVVVVPDRGETFNQVCELEAAQLAGPFVTVNVALCDNGFDPPTVPLNVMDRGEREMAGVGLPPPIRCESR